MKVLAERFEVAGLRYRLLISTSGQLMFALTGGATQRGAFKPHFFFDDQESVADVDLLSVNPIKVFRQVKKRLLAWVGSQKPYQFYFHACTARRCAIYRWMAKRLDRSLPDYQLYEYEGSFYFYRVTHGEMLLCSKEICRA